ncbi:MAG TPA: PAS domain S-box protein [Chloroflexota bacterium]|nr:PAS domain S-box protein [Chloroflexota bacterium]
MTDHLPPKPSPRRRSGRRAPSSEAHPFHHAERSASDAGARASRLRQAEAALVESETRYRLLTETSTDGIIAIDQDDRIVFVNQATGQIFGYQPDELIGKDLRILIPPDLRERHVAGLHRYLQTGERHLNWRGSELPGLRKDGTIVPLEIAFGESQHDEKHLFFGYARDITERKKAEEERQALLHELEDERTWLRTVIERSPIGILLVEGAHGERVVANTRAEKLFGQALPPEGGIGQYVGQILHPDGNPRQPQELAVTRALHGEPVFGEEELLRHADGTETRALVSAVPIRAHGLITGAVVVYEDITRIRDLERLREEWTSVIAHDLRQPVTVITAYGSLLRRRIEKTVGENDRAALDHILTAAHNLNKMIADLLDISRIEAGRLELEKQPVDLPALVRAVVARLAPLTDGHPIQIQVAGEIPTVAADPTRVEQVLGNLLSNAVKYGYPNTPIQVAIARDPAGALVSVTNEGPGIAPTELPHLFTRFYRSPVAHQRAVPGIGLGLYISKGIVEAHHGRIWVDSVVGGRTTFHFLLPLSGDLAR